MKKAREQVAKMLGKKHVEKMDEDEKHIIKHLNRDMKESKKSIKEDKDLKKYLRKH